jgi:hypothetical protein
MHVDRGGLWYKVIVARYWEVGELIGGRKEWFCLVEAFGGD